MNYSNYNSRPLTDPKAFLRTITIIHAALLMGQVLFVIVSFVITRDQQVKHSGNNDPLVYVVPLVAVACFFASNFMFRQLLNAAAGRETLLEKLTAYQTALIVRYALLEGPSLFGIVAFLVSGNMIFLVVSALLIVYFIAVRPTRDRTETDLNLSFEEKAEMSGDSSPIK